MVIKYKNEKLKKILQNEKEVTKKYNKNVYFSFRNKIKELLASDNLQKVSLINKGMKIEKLQFSKQHNNKNGFLWSFRINEQYRCNFLTEKENDSGKIKEIVIQKVHPHEYDK